MRARGRRFVNIDVESPEWRAARERVADPWNRVRLGYSLDLRSDRLRLRIRFECPTQGPPFSSNQKHLAEYFINFPVRHCAAHFEKVFGIRAGDIAALGFRCVEGFDNNRCNLIRR